MNTKFVKLVALKAGYVLGSLKANNAVPNWFTAIIASQPEGLGIIEARFAPDMEAGLLRETGNVYRVEVNNVDKTSHLIHLTFVIVRRDAPEDEIEDPQSETEEQRRLGKPKGLPIIGSVVKSVNGYYGQVIAYSKDTPRLIRVRWQRPSRLTDRPSEEFQTWENPENQEIVSEPDLNTTPGVTYNIFHPDQSLDAGVPVSELLSGERELSPDDAEYQKLMDAEARYGPKQPAVRVKLSPWQYGNVRSCACGCNGTCTWTFCAGHDARAKGLLQRKMRGGEPHWVPNADLIAYIESKPLWYDQFGEFVQQFKLPPKE